MKIIVLFMCVLSLCSCTTDVSFVPPHSSLVGTNWQLKQDSYIVEYQDNKGDYLVFPCVPFFASRFPDGSYKYNKQNIGRMYDGDRKIVGGVAAGELVQVLRVLEVRNPEVGTTHKVIAKPVLANEWTGMKELNLKYYYHYFSPLDKKGHLDDRYVLMK